MPASFETCFETLPNKKGGKRGKELRVGRHLSELLAFAFLVSQKSSPCEDYTCSSLDKTSAAQLLSREPRVFISRPNVRGTLVAVEKAASHSVSLSTIITWGARSRFKRVW